VSFIVTELYDRLKPQLSKTAWERIRAKAQWGQMTLSAVIKEYPDLLPKRLRSLAASCFVETRRDWLVSRRAELTRLLRQVEAELAHRTVVPVERPAQEQKP